MLGERKIVASEVVLRESKNGNGWLTKGTLKKARKTI